ncbi:MAG TPA: hypothetical protein VFB26_03350 [Gaiellaceae bacterium]|nr:hypothetical protein [Gaiellaceae bacterium]
MAPLVRIARRPGRTIELLLRHCATAATPRRPSAQARLEAELGPDLARRLVTILTVGSRG